MEVHIVSKQLSILFHIEKPLFYSKSEAKSFGNKEFS